MKPTNTVITLILVLILTGTACINQSDSEIENNDQVNSIPRDLVEVSLRMPIPVVDTAFSPYYLATDKGFFEENGLEVTIEPGTPELNPAKMLTQGTNQFAVLGGPELLFTARANGSPLVAIALLHKDSDFVVLVTGKESGITELEQLQGADVGFFYGHISTDILHMLFNKMNVEVNEVDVGFDYGQLISGALDASWAFRTTAGITLPAKDFEINIISPADYGIMTQGHVIVTTEDMINHQPDVVQSFLNACLQGLEYSVEHPDEAVESSVNKDPNFDPAIGDAQMVVYSETILNNDPKGWIPSDVMEVTKSQMVELGILDEGFNVDAAFDTQFLEAYYGQS